MNKFPQQFIEKIIFIIMALFLMATGKVQAQEFVHDEDFKKKTSQGIVVIEFWASFNEANQVPLKKLIDCKKYRVDMSQDPNLMTKHNVVGVPTLIIYNNGKEIKRFLPTIMMKLGVEIKDVQKEIDKLMEDKF